MIKFTSQKIFTHLLLMFLSHFYCYFLLICSSLFYCPYFDFTLLCIFLKLFQVIIVSLLFVSTQTVSSFNQSKNLVHDPLINFKFDKFY